MIRFSRLWTALTAVLVLSVSCSNMLVDLKKSSDGSGASNIYSDANSLSPSSFSFASTDSASGVTQDFTVPTTGPSGSTISWTATPAGVISVAGGHAQVSLPAGVTSVTLTATVVSGGVSTTKDLTVTAKAKAASGTNAATADLAALSNASLGFGTGDSTASVTQNFHVPTSGPNGSDISWSTSPTGVISVTDDQATLTRPASDTAVKLTATVASGGSTLTKDYSLTVKAKEASGTAAATADATAAVTANTLEFAGTDDATSITQGFTLPVTGPNGSTITWTATPAGVLTIDPATGLVTVTVPTSDTPVTLTATVTSGGVTVTKTLTVTVKGTNGNTALTADLAAFTASSLTFHGTDTSGTISREFYLPTKGTHGSTFSWSAKPRGIISVQGKLAKVHLPSKSTTVHLTATLTNGTGKASKTIDVTVNGKPSDDPTKVSNDKATVDTDSPTFTGTDTSTNVTEPFGLPVDFPNDSTGTWVASPSGLFDILDTGYVIPKPQVAKTPATLTVTIKSGGTTDTKTINVTVGPAAVADATAVTNDSTALTASSISYGGSDTSTSVTQGFTVPIKGDYGSSITWSASPAGILNINLATGAITINTPSVDTLVTLTATITKGSSSTTKTFGVTVKSANAAAVAADAAALSTSSITFGGTDNGTSVTQGFTLPTTGGHGTTITWTASPAGILTVSGGTVTLATSPSVDTTVTLTATVTKNGVTATKTVTVTVKGLSDSEALGRDLSALTASAFTFPVITPTIVDAVTVKGIARYFYVPVKGKYGSTITWQTANTTIIPAISANDGFVSVTPPNFPTDVALTATVTKGASSITRTFNLTFAASSKSLYGLGTSDDGVYMTTVTQDSSNYVLVSASSGSTWVERASKQSWTDVTVSSSGQYQVAVGKAGIYTSANSGASWTQTWTNPGISSIDRVTSNSSGSCAVVIGYNRILYSTDYGNTWTQVTSGTATNAGNWWTVSITNDGAFFLLGTYGGDLYVYNRNADTWQQISSSTATRGQWMASAFSSDQNFVALTNGESFYYYGSVSVTGVPTATKVTGATGYGWLDATWSRTNDRIWAVAYNDGVFYSDDKGATWTSVPGTSSLYLMRVTTSYDGSTWRAASLTGSAIYIGTTSGITDTILVD